MNDTIANISTTLGIGAISIIRVSGSKSISIVNKIFKGHDLNKVKSHTIHYGFIVNNDENIDEVLISIMKSPHTYTKEDIVEINCHGGIISTNKILELILLNGARLSEPGEFTKRAFLNGRIDLMKAEAVMDIINAKNEVALKTALNTLEGKSSTLIKNLREIIFNLISNIEVNIDYPEYEDIYEVTINDIKSNINVIKKHLEDIINEYNATRIIKDGIKVVIVGKPNVGKSSILNNLIGENKAIVTSIPGTTRDIVEGTININGINMDIIDTAGIRETNDLIEQIGVNKSYEVMNKNADLILFVLNNNEKLSNEEMNVIDSIKKPYIVVVNKSDLNSNINLDLLKGKTIVYTNTVDIDGLNLLKIKIKEMFDLENITKKDYNYLANTRQLVKIKESLKTIGEIEEGLINNISIDLIEIDLKRIWNNLGEIIGECYSDELLDQLFQKFCVGK